MNISKQQEVTYDITDLTETQAFNLLETCITLGTKSDEFENDFTLDEFETINNLRQALLGAGVGRNKGATNEND